MALAGPPSDSSGKARKKTTGSKQPAGTRVKPRTTTGKRVIAMPETASAEIVTEHEEVSMSTEMTATGEPPLGTGETLENKQAHGTPGEHSEAQTGPAKPEIISAYAGSSMERAAEPARFNIFIIDSGWNPLATQILRENLTLIRELNPSDGTFLLDRDRSISVLRRHPGLIGRDPIISVHDLDTVDPGSKQYGAVQARVHGFRLHLGLVKTEEKIKDALEMFVRFLRRHRASRNLEKDVREKLRKEGFTGAIEIMGHGVELFRG